MKDKYFQLIASLTDKDLLYHLYLTQFMLLIISFAAGFFLYDHFSFLSHFHLNDTHIVTIGLPLGIGVVILDILLMKMLPASFYNDGGLNERIFKNKHVAHILLITVLVSFSEELLFRGVIQTKVGLIAASIIFAIIHYRYLFNWYLFTNIVLLSFVIGLVYEWTANLAVPMMMHFVIDFFLGVYISFKHSRSTKGNGR